MGSGNPPRNFLVFYLNGRKHEVHGVEPETTLLQYLRSSDVALKGTKLGCGEGGCGACTVMVSTYEYESKAIKHAAVNACLAPLCSVDWCHVTTIEGIGSTGTRLHPIQERIAEMHGSQCGFCTPGMAMAVYALLRSNPSASAEEIEAGLDGNLCRCTGYRPILDAAKSLGRNAGALSGCSRGKDGSCPCLDDKFQSMGFSRDTSEGGTILKTSNGTTKELDGPTLAHSASDDQGVSPKQNSESGVKKPCITESTASRAQDPRYAERYSDKGEPIFPPALALKAPSEVTITGERVTWHYPTSLKALKSLKATHPEAKIVAGNTRVGVEVRYEGMQYPILIASTRVPEIRGISSTNSDGISYEEDGIFIGGATPIHEIQHALARMDGRAGPTTAGKEPGSGSVAGAFVDMLRWFGSAQIRNVACLAGSLASASPASDTNPLLAACGASVLLDSIKGGSRCVKVRDFFISQGKAAMEPNEVIVGILLPHAAKRAPFEFVRPFKQARRREGDSSIVTAGLRVRLEVKGGRWIVAEAGLCFGGMADTTVAAKRTEAYLVGKEWTAEVMAGAYQTLAEDLPLPQDVAGKTFEYRRALPPSFLFKFFVDVCLKLQVLCARSDGQLPPPPAIGESDRTAASSYLTDSKPMSWGEQEYTPREGGLQCARPEPHAPKLTALAHESDESDKKEQREDMEMGSVGKPLPHMTAKLQAAGEAIYIDDLRLPQGTLYAGLVLATKAHAKILSVDSSAALGMEGVVRYLCAKDLPPDSNLIGPIVTDEEVFASDEVECFGQVIGAVLAETTFIAEQAAKLVKVEYDDLPAIISIEDAIKAESFFLPPLSIVSGDVEKDLADSDVVVEGEFKIGGQEHFYLETHITLAVPGEDRSMEIFASTQNLMLTQKACAKICGVPSNKVVCRTKRMGGGFGGKESRSVFVSCIAAAGAHLTGRPVHLKLDRRTDMQISGHRHSIYAKYKAGASKDGKLRALDVSLYTNGGCTMDLSPGIAMNSIFHIDNCYRWPSLRAHGKVCKSNQASHTAFRGFGSPQGMFVCEAAIDHIASALGRQPSEIRALNLYQEGDSTHYGQELEKWNVPEGWSHLYKWADIPRREKEVDEFNATNRWRKRGLSIIPTKLGISFVAKFLNQGGALVHVYVDGSVLVSHGGTEMGQGLHTKICQVVAREFGIEMDKVRISETATDRVPNATPSAASMSIDLYGMATLDACEQITARLRPVAKTLPPTASFADIVQAAYFQRINLSAQGFYKAREDAGEYDFSMETDDNRKRGTPYFYFTQGVAACEVEVDCLTGDARMLRVDVVMDIGTSINPAIDIGQIEGAFLQGFGWCTMEETAWGDSNHPWAPRGQLLTCGPGGYKIPSVNDVPLDMRVKLMDKKNALAVHSSKAVGEPPFFLSTSAFFAIKHAVAAARKDHGEEGYFPFMSPATSERIRTACLDRFMEASAGVEAKAFQAAGSW